MHLMRVTKGNDIMLDTINTIHTTGKYHGNAHQRVYNVV